MTDGSKPVRILHVIDGLGAGGAETWLLQCVRYLHNHPELGVQFDFLATGGEKRIFDEEILQLGSKIYYVRFSLLKIFTFRKKVINILKNNEYPAIHSHQDFVSGWHYLLTAGYNPRIRIAHLHNPYNFVVNYSSSSLRKVSYYIGRFLMGRLATHITGTSNAVMDEYGYTSGIYKKKRIDPCYCGFTVDDFSYNPAAKGEISNELGWPVETKVGVFVGRLDLGDDDKAKNQKNPAFAFKIARELVRQFPDWRFLFVGDKGEYGEKLEVRVKELGIDDKIKFLGIRRDISKIMSACSVLVFPSLFEGLGMVVVEAQASGLRVLMSDTVPQEAKVVPELVFEKSLNQNEGEWIKKLLEVEKDTTERSSFSNIIKSSKFSINNSVQHLLSTYHL